MIGNNLMEALKRRSLTSPRNQIAPVTPAAPVTASSDGGNGFLDTFLQTAKRIVPWTTRQLVKRNKDLFRAGVDAASEMGQGSVGPTTTYIPRYGETANQGLLKSIMDAGKNKALRSSGPTTRSKSTLSESGSMGQSTVQPYNPVAGYFANKNLYNEANAAQGNPVAAARGNSGLVPDPMKYGGEGSGYMPIPGFDYKQTPSGDTMLESTMATPMESTPQATAPQATAPEETGGDVPEQVLNPETGLFEDNPEYLKRKKKPIAEAAEE